MAGAISIRMGCVLHEMLSGSPPHLGNSVLAITSRKLADPVPTFGPGMDTVSQGLREVLEHLLNRDPAQRYPSAASLIEALDQVSGGAGKPVHDRPNAPGRRRSRSCRSSTEARSRTTSSSATA